MGSGSGPGYKDNMLDIIGLLIALTAIFSYLNHRFIRLPTTIGVMCIALVLSLLLIGAGQLGLASIEQWVEGLVLSIDFYAVLMHGMLSLLLFAGALHIDLSALAARKRSIGILATVGTISSTFLVGGIAYLLFQTLGIELSFIFCLLFGSLISPTDPIAVLGILKSANAPKSLEIKIAGESLFNDGVAVVIFTILLSIALGDKDVTVPGVALLFVKEAIGGAVFGLVIGYIAYRMIRSIDSYHVEVLITLGLVLGGYALALHLHVSGLIAMVVAGLLIGNHGRALAMSDETRVRIDTFWEIVDELLNAVLFVLIGLEIVVLTFSGQMLLAAVLMIVVVLGVRFITVGIPIALLRKRWSVDFTPHSVKLLTWAGVRGGISVALALSLPPGDERDVILAVTYVVVLFSILVQGLTIGRLIRATLADQPAD